MQTRELGKTGEQLSIIGFGGVTVTDKMADVDQTTADAFVGEAVERGVNWFDVSPSYGNAEQQLGPALKEFRKDVFLACKTARRDKAGAAEDLRSSLKTLQTDHFDLYQFMAMKTQEDLETAMGPGGALEALAEARHEGLVRYLGFSAHTADVAVALMDQFDFDTAMFPINFACCMKTDFGPQVLAKAEEKGTSVLAIKAMALKGRGPDEGGDRSNRKGEYPRSWYHPVSDPETMALAVRFTLSQPVVGVIPTGDVRLLRQALDIADEFTPLTDAERDELERRAEGFKPMFPTG